MDEDCPTVQMTPNILAYITIIHQQFTICESVCERIVKSIFESTQLYNFMQHFGPVGTSFRHTMLDTVQNRQCKMLTVYCLNTERQARVNARLVIALLFIVCGDFRVIDYLK